MLVINREGEQGSIDDIEDYDLPVLQDTGEADVFGLWGASSYDLFVVDRAGFVGYAEPGAHPLDEEDHFLEVLSRYQ